MPKYPKLSSSTLSFNFTESPRFDKSPRFPKVHKIFNKISRSRNRTNPLLYFQGKIRILIRIFGQMTRSGNSQLTDRWKLSKKKSLRDEGGASRTTRSSGQAQGKYGFTRKCGRLAREQRARFYIMRRCVVMLICWTDNHNYSDHS